MDLVITTAGQSLAVSYGGEHTLTDTSALPERGLYQQSELRAKLLTLDSRTFRRVLYDGHIIDLEDTLAELGDLV